MKNISMLINEIATQLAPVYPQEPLRTQTAWWILSAITKKSEAELIAQEQITLNASENSTLAQWLSALINDKKPLAYVLGSVPFYELTILTKPPILIPRPETEEWVVNLGHQLQQLTTKNIRILDIGTGTGCIPLTLAAMLPDADIYSVDVDPQALDLAQKNAAYNNISSVTFLSSDLFTELPSDQTFHLIVSNPPYISRDEWRTVDDAVKHWESSRALLADNDGLFYIEQIIREAPSHIMPHAEMKEKNIPQLILEIGYQQGNAARTRMTHAQYNDIRITQDSFGNDRTISGRVDHVADANHTK